MAYCTHYKVFRVFKIKVTEVFLGTLENGTFVLTLMSLHTSPIILVILTIENHQDNAMILQRERMTVSLLLFKTVL